MGRPAGPEPKRRASDCAHHRTTAISRYRDAGRKHRSALKHTAWPRLATLLWLRSAAASLALSTEGDGTELQPQPSQRSRSQAGTTQTADPCSGSTSLLEFRGFVRPTPLAFSCGPRERSPRGRQLQRLVGRQPVTRPAPSSRTHQPSKVPGAKPTEPNTSAMDRIAGRRDGAAACDLAQNYTRTSFDRPGQDVRTASDPHRSC